MAEEKLPIPDDMPRTDPNPAHMVDGWEAVNSVKPELGVLQIAKVPGSLMIGLFIRHEAIMFPLAYFTNWHAAHRFAAWMEASDEPKPTFADEYRAMLKKKRKKVDEAAGITAVIEKGRMTFETSDTPVIPTQGLPRWPEDKD